MHNYYHLTGHIPGTDIFDNVPNTYRVVILGSDVKSVHGSNEVENAYAQFVPKHCKIIYVEYDNIS